MKKTFILVFLVTALHCFSQKRATGLVFNDNVYQKTDRLSPALKFTTGDLPAASLKMYCPNPGNQGQSMGSCVGWAAGYAALSISTAIKNNITDKTQITQQARSALYIYNQIKINGCPNGADMHRALEFVKTNGDCLKKDFDPNDCEMDPSESVRQMALEFKIKDYYTLFSVDATPEQKIIATINSIISKKPVLVGLVVTSSIFRGVGSKGEWNPDPGESVEGGHALCVIGYDNMSERFEIINSWGTDWGNNGFFTISYKNFARLCKYGYQFNLQDNAKNTTVSLTGNFKFKKYKGYDASTSKYQFDEVPVQLNGTSYTIDDIHVNDFFRISASNISKDKYVYIFSIKPDKTAEILFPINTTIDGVSVKDIPIVPSNDAVIEIPIDEKKGLTTDQAGDDILCILYSSELINDIEAVVKNIKNDSGEFYTRLQNALGSKLIPSSDITYNPSTMGITTSSNKGTIAPIILQVNVKN